MPTEKWWCANNKWSSSPADTRRAPDPEVAWNTPNADTSTPLVYGVEPERAINNMIETKVAKECSDLKKVLVAMAEQQIKMVTKMESMEKMCNSWCKIVAVPPAV